MIRYVVVTRDHKLPIERFFTVEAAAAKIRDEQSFDRWTVMAQEANKITASTPYRPLFDTERRKLEAVLFPSLYDE